ncbi:MAG: aspartate ammonia-lyase, partial [Patescibacteria group bacterium]
ACAEVNFGLGLLDKKVFKAITQAAQEFSGGKFDEEFPIDPIQAGAGTPYNMNANEVIANRANEILGKDLGSYDPVHPNNHVNLSQSSNDVTPTAIRIAALFLLSPLLDALDKMTRTLRTFSQKHANVIKVGRTHLEDAVPMTLGQEFRAYATMLEKSKKRIAQASRELLEIGLGGTALGTGITTHPYFQKKVAAKLAKLTRLPLTSAEDLCETTSSMNVFVALSGGLRMLAVDLVKIANDLKLLNMGPLAGIAEITLPEVEPGSSIMPGKVNPSVAEAVHMAAYDVMASDYAVALGAQAGQLELNVMTPLILKHLLGALSLLTNTCEMFRRDCLEGIVVNEKQIKGLFEGSLVTATALSPYLGYQVTAELVKEALATNKSIVYVLRQKGFIADDDIARLLSVERTTRPASVDLTLKKKIERNEAYQKYKAYEDRKI